MKGNIKTSIGGRPVLVGWSWRESNPRPNRETIRFLHAYSSLRFSCCGKTWTT